MNKLFCFKFSIFSHYGHFRKHYTNTRLTTYLYPSKPTVLGLIGAIMGWNYETVEMRTEDILIGISILNEKINIEVDLMTIYKVQGKKITPAVVNQENLVNPNYLIYAASKDETIIDEMYQRIANYNFIYSLYMGKNEFPITKINIKSNIEPANKQDISKPKTIVFHNRPPLYNLLNQDYVFNNNIQMPFYEMSIPVKLKTEKKRNNLNRICTSQTNSLVKFSCVEIELKQKIDGYYLENSKEEIFFERIN